LHGLVSAVFVEEGTPMVCVDGMGMKFNERSRGVEREVWSVERGAWSIENAVGNLQLENPSQSDEN
jgi:hypothetical protein